MPTRLGRSWERVRLGELRRLVLGALLVMTFATVAAGAADETRIVVRTSDDALGARIMAEAALLDLSVIRAEPGDAEEPAATMERHEAVAIIDLDTSGPPTLIYRDDSGVLQRRPVGTSKQSDATAVVVVEAVRAALLELDLIDEETERPSTAPATSASRPVMPAPEPGPLGIAPVEAAHGGRDEADRSIEGQEAGSDARLWLGLGPAGTVAAGGMGPTVHGALGLAVEPGHDLRVFAAAWLPVTSRSWSTGSVTAEADPMLLFGGVDYELLHGGDGLVDVGLGAGLLSLGLEAESRDATGRAAEASERLFAGVYFAHAGGAYRLAPWLRLRGDALFGTSAPRPVVDIAQERSATWGRLFAGIALSAEVGILLSSAGGHP